jgi:hypothetical protein
MTRQLDLFDPPATHSHDPETSRLALDAHESTGARGRNQRIVLDMVKRWPGYTACELWMTATPDEIQKLKELQEIRRRCCDLESKGLVVKGPARLCRVKNTRQTTWVAFTGR